MAQLKKSPTAARRASGAQQLQWTIEVDRRLKLLTTRSSDQCSGHYCSCGTSEHGYGGCVGETSSKGGSHQSECEHQPKDCVSMGAAVRE